LPDFISAAVNGHDEVAVIGRLTQGREQQRAQKFPEQQDGGTVSILHNHQAGKFFSIFKQAVVSHCMTGLADQINNHVTARLADLDGLGSPVFQPPR
jgi:hypothetical protein